MSTTPRTDARELAISIQNEDSCCAIYVKIDGKEYEGGLVDTDFARDLERENAELRKDKARLRETCEQHRAYAHMMQEQRSQIADYCRTLEKQIAELLAANAELITVGAEQPATADELRAENAELRRDKARLDWLERPQQITHYVNPFRDVVHRTNSGQTLREAIDAAMGETK